MGAAWELRASAWGLRESCVEAARGGVWAALLWRGGDARGLSCCCVAVALGLRGWRCGGTWAATPRREGGVGEARKLHCNCIDGAGVAWGVTGDCM